MEWQFRPGRGVQDPRQHQQVPRQGQANGPGDRRAFPQIKPKGPAVGLGGKVQGGPQSPKEPRAEKDQGKAKDKTAAGEAKGGRVDGETWVEVLKRSRARELSRVAREAEAAGGEKVGVEPVAAGPSTVGTKSKKESKQAEVMEVDEEMDPDGYATATDAEGGRPGGGSKAPASKKLEQVQKGLQAIELLRGMDLPGMEQSWEALAKKLQAQEAGWAEESKVQGKGPGAGKGSGGRRPPTDVLLQRSRQKAAKLDKKLQHLQDDEEVLLEVRDEVEKHLGHLREQQREVEMAIDQEEEYRKKLAASLAKSAGVQVVQGSDDSSEADEACSLSGDSGSDAEAGGRRKKRKGPANVPRELQVPTLAKKILKGMRAGASAEAAAVHVALRAWLESAGQKGVLEEGGNTEERPEGPPASTAPGGPCESTKAFLEHLVVETKVQIECGDEAAKAKLEAVQQVMAMVADTKTGPPQPSGEGKGGRSGRSQPY